MGQRCEECSQTGVFLGACNKEKVHLQVQNPKLPLPDKEH